MGQMPKDIFHHDYGAIDDHAEVQSAQGEQVRGNLVEIQANRREQKRKWNRQSHNEGGARVTQEKKEDDGNKKYPFGEVMQHRLGRVVNEITAI